MQNSKVEMKSWIMNLSQGYLNYLFVTACLITFVHSQDISAVHVQLRKELVGGPLKNDGILHSIATEIYRRNASDREIFAESILRSTFSRLINNRCANSSQCRDSLYFPHNQMMVTQHLASLLSKPNVTLRSTSVDLKYQDELDIFIRKNITAMAPPWYGQHVEEIRVDNLSTAIYITYRSRNMVNLNELLARPSATHFKECEIDDDIIAFLLFDQNFSPIQNLFVTLKFAHTALLDDEETHCMSWDFTNIKWDDTHCMQGNSNNNGGFETLCICNNPGHFALLRCKKTTIIEELENLQNTSSDQLKQKFSMEISNHPDPVDFTRSVLNIISKILEESSKNHTTDAANFPNTVIQLIEYCGFSLLNYTAEDSLNISSNVTNMTVYKDIKPGYVTCFNSSSSFGKLCVQFPDDAIASGIRLTPGVVVTYDNVENILTALNPSLRPNSTLNSPVIAVSVMSSTPKHLVGDNITVTLPHKHLLVSGFTSVCVYWNFSQGFWDSAGCTLLPTSNASISNCSCNHLTHFAVLQTVSKKSFQEELINNLVNGRLIDDEILESFKNEADSVIGDDLEKFALKIMEITFSRQVHDACNVKPQCKNSLNLQNNQMMVIECLATMLSRNNVSLSRTPFKLNFKDELEIDIRRDLTTVGSLEYNRKFSRVHAKDNFISDMYIKYGSSNLVNLSEPLARYPATHFSRCKIDDDIIAFQLFDKSFSAIENLEVTMRFSLSSDKLDDEETHCVSWNFTNLKWDDTKCTKEDSYNFEAICLCNSPGHFAVLKCKKTTMLEDLLNLHQTTFDNLQRKFSMEISNHSDPVGFTRSVLNTISTTLNHTTDHLESSNTLMRLTEYCGFSLLNYTTEESLNISMSETNMTIYKNIKPGFIADFNSSSPFGKLSVKFPDDIHTVTSGMNSTPAVVVTYDNVENILTALNPSLRSHSTLNSPVIAVSVMSSTPKHLVGDNITVTLPHKHLLVSGFTSVCVYWDFNRRFWDSQGCSLTAESSASFSICSCNHLTTFAVLTVHNNQPDTNTTIIEDITNIGNTPVDDLIYKVNDAISSHSDPVQFAETILSNVSQLFQEDFERRTVYPVKNASNLMRLTEEIGFSLLNRITQDTYIATNITNMTIYKNIKAGHIVYFNSSSDDRQLSLQFPSDVEELFPQMTSIPAVVVHYISVGNALNAFNPSLPKNSSVNSQVIGASLVSTEPKPLKHNVTIHLPHTLPLNNRSKSICTSWDFHKRRWDAKGCILTANSSDTLSICSCNHLTNFVVLTSYYTDPDMPLDPILNFISAAGCIISAVSLVICICCFVGIRALRSTRNTIHINLCACLLTANVCMVISIFYESWRNNSETEMKFQGFCLALSTMLHYFYLTSFMWMGIEGYHVYQSFVRIFDRSVPLKWFYVISYGVSVVIVGSTTLAITLKNDVNNDVVVDVDDDVVVDVDDDVVVDLDGDANAKRLRSFSCWITAADSSYNWIFLSFVIVILLFNVIMAVISLKKVSSRIAPRRVKQVDKGKARNLFWQVTVLHPLLGFPWILGFFQFRGIDDTLNTISVYVGTLLMSLQGFFIFFFHCFRNTHVQVAFAKYMSCCKCFFKTGSKLGSNFAINAATPLAKDDVFIMNTPRSAKS